MNAYELAEILETNNFLNPNATKEVANMLRQQADRIAELEKEKENYKYDPETGEPLIDGYPLFSGLPTPQTKPLSDEEINEAYLKYVNSGWDWQIEFARAIEERHGIK